jgi:hypothetical protein
MQLHLETNELNLLANILMERTGSANDDTASYNELLDMVLARDLRFDCDQLEQLAGLLATAKRRLKEEISRQPGASPNADLLAKLALLGRVQERVDEACVMF